MIVDNFTIDAAREAGIPEINVTEVKFMGTAQNGSILVYGNYPNGDHFEDTISGEFASVKHGWEDVCDYALDSDEDGNVLGFAVIDCKEWL